MGCTGFDNCTTGARAFLAPFQLSNGAESPSTHCQESNFDSLKFKFASTSCILRPAGLPASVPLPKYHCRVSASANRRFATVFSF